MSPVRSNNVAATLRPVVIVVAATKIAIVSFLVAGMAGLVPMPATAEDATAQVRSVD